VVAGRGAGVFEEGGEVTRFVMTRDEGGRQAW